MGSDEIGEMACEHRPDESGKGPAMLSKGLRLERVEHLSQSPSVTALFCDRQNVHSIVIVGQDHVSKFSRGFKKLTCSHAVYFRSA
jgi:hypothetical protein